MTRDLVATMDRVIPALRALAIDLDIDTDELGLLLAFLTDVGRNDEFILLSDVLGISQIVDDRSHSHPDATAPNVLGPFYRDGAPWIDNPGSIVRDPGPGQPLTLLGIVRDGRSGDPVPGAVIDVWQADETGRYSSSIGPGDPWHLRGRQRTDATGGYRIETRRPLYYTIKDDGPVGALLRAMGRHPWRPAHVHYQVSADGFKPLVTQAYLSGGPYLEDDTIGAVRSELIVEADAGVLPFDVRLARLPG